MRLARTPWAVLLLGAAVWAQAAAPPAPAPGELSREFSVSEARIRKAHGQGLSYAEVRTALILSKATGLKLRDIAGMRRAGVSFQDIAERQKLDLDEVMANYEQSRLREAPSSRRTEEDETRARQVAGRFGVSQDEVMAVRRQGLDWPSVERAFDVARRARGSALEAADLRTRGLGWPEIESRLSQAQNPDVQSNPLWNSPSNPFAEQEWNDQRQWYLYRSDKGFPREQLDNERERRPR